VGIPLLTYVIKLRLYNGHEAESYAVSFAYIARGKDPEETSVSNKSIHHWLC